MDAIRGVATAQVLRVLCGLLFCSGNSNAEREIYVFVDQVVELPRHSRSASLMVHGYVVEDSIRERRVEETNTLTFSLAYAGQQIRVVRTGPLSPTLRDLGRVEVRGSLVQQDGEQI